MKTAIAMLALCGLVIGGGAWGHPCPEGEGAAVNQTTSPLEQTSSDYEALRPLYSTFGEADRDKRRVAREKGKKHAYINTSYPSYKSEYMAWEILKAVKRLGRKGLDEHEALRPLYSAFGEADRDKRRVAREKGKKRAYLNTSYPAYKTEYILWEILKELSSEGFCK